MPKFSITQNVRTKNGETGIIIEGPLNKQGVVYYKVFISAFQQPFIPEEDLFAVGLTREPKDLLQQGYFSKIRDFRCFLTLMKLNHPLTNVIYSFLSSRTENLAYQFLPLLKILDSPHQRLLIADEVGMGKTIEAGIIMTELKSRMELRRILVICQGYLLQYKWKMELNERFDEDFKIYERNDLEEFFRDYADGKNPPLRAICSLPLMRADYFRQMLNDSSIPFDLVIFDEAHRLRNEGTKSHELGEYFSQNAEVLLFLTATPLHLGSKDLFTLMNLLVPSEFSDYQDFGDYIEPNEYINEAISKVRKKVFEPQDCLESLNNVLITRMRQQFKKNPLFIEATSWLNQKSEWSREDLVALEDSLTRLNVLSHVFTRARRRDIDIDFPERTPFTLKIYLSPLEKRFLDEFHEFAYQIQLRSEIPFGTIMLRRQFASCMPALQEYLRDNILGNADGFKIDKEIEIDDIEMDDTEISDNIIESKYRTLNLTPHETEIAKQLCDDSYDLENNDSKFKLLLENLNEQRQNGVVKFLMFSFFKRTLKYLYRRILEETDLRVGLLTGDLSYDKRIKIMDEFRKSDRPYILLSSEVGGEGLDFQFCNVMFNYDLPWNPMVVEQRIGRIDRYGQKSERILIFNFQLPETIEDRVFFKLYERIEIFKKTIGDLEAILGNELSTLYRDLLTPKLTEQEKEDRGEEVERIIIKRKKQFDEMEKESVKFLGNDGFFISRIDDIQKSRKFLTQQELYDFVKSFIEIFTPKANLKMTKEQDVWILRNGDEIISFFNRYYDIYGKLDVLNVLIPKLSRDLTLTFSASVANDQRHIEFINPRHPLIQAMTKHLEVHLQQDIVLNAGLSPLEVEAAIKNKGILPTSSIRAFVENLTPGKFIVYLYMITVQSVFKELNLLPIAISLEEKKYNEEISKNFFRLLHEEEIDDNTTIGPMSEENLISMQIAADNYISGFIQKRKEDIGKNNDSWIEMRLESLRRTRDIRLERIESILNKVKNPSILNMKLSEKRNIEQRFERDKDKIERDREINVRFELKAACRLEILN